jgi:hypothetical protein
MAITQAMCTSFKVQLLKGQHNFTNGAHIFNLALFQETATLGAATTNYTTANEAASGGSTNYAAGGKPLTNVTPSDGGSGTTAFTSFSTLTWQSSTITAAGALIYNTETNGSGTPTTDSVIVLNFGGNKSSTSGDFSIVFPTANASDAIIRIQ